jgi:hypothetical protein
MHSTSHGRATTIEGAFRACDVGPLSPENDEWWADLAEVRRSPAVARLEGYYDLCAPGQFTQLAFTGHRGCGKSTELLRLRRRVAGRFLVVYFEVTELLDPNDIAFSDLFVAVSMKTAQAMHDAGMPLDPSLLQRVEDFAASVVREATQADESLIDLGGHAELGVEIPLVTKLKAWLTSQYKAATQHKETIRRVIERDITRLIDDTNRLLECARSALTRKLIGGEEGPRDVLLILDNLDRLPPEVGERLVFRHGDFLRQIRAHVIYTVPVSVLYSPSGLATVFPEHEVLPMVPVYRYDARNLELSWDEDSVSALAGVVGERLDVDTLFASRDLLAQLARHSGGCLRHLMQLVRHACVSAHTAAEAVIGQRHIDEALLRMQLDFERMVPTDHFPVLAEVARTKRVPDTDVGRAALFNSSVLEYDGGRRWNYVHPLVRRMGGFSEALDAKRVRKRRGTSR